MSPSILTAGPGAINRPEQRDMQQQMGVWIAGTLLALGLIVGGIITLFTRQLYVWAILLTLGTVIAFAVFTYKGYTSERFEWTGFGQYKGSEDRDHQPRMLWDWLTLLIIPIVLAAGAIGFGTFQNQENFNLSQAQFHLAATQYVNDQNIAATQYANAQQLALENSFQTYLDRMTDLLTNPHVHEDTQLGRDIRSMATARTLTILPDLALPRKATVLKFLHDAGLISRQSTDQNIIDPVVNLNGADFSGVDLNGFVLRGADLAFVNFKGARLMNADLDGAFLAGANLTGANLAHADLSFAQLFNQQPNQPSEIANLTGAHLNGANLTGANLIQANLTSAVLNGANLSIANLDGAIVTNTDFTNVTWKNTTCPDDTNSDANNPGSCNVG